MRRIALATVVSTLTVIAIGCADPITPPDSAAPSLARSSAAGKVAICHAAGRADDPKFVAIEVSRSAESAHMGTHGTERAGHEVDYYITARTPCPPPPTPGIVRICKSVLPGIAAGTPFTFVITGRNVPTRTVTVAAGSCADLPYRVGTTVNVRENVPANTVLTGVTLTPGTGAISNNTVSAISGTDVARATFTNRSTTHGTLTVCKVAGTANLVGTSFGFSVGGVQRTIPAGAGPGGGCISSITPQGSVTVIENPPPLGTTLTSIVANPTTAATAVSVPNRTAVVRVTAGADTRVTFTNTRP